MAKGFSFGSKAQKRKKVTPQKPLLTEIQVSEDNPDLEKLAAANKERLKRDNAKYKAKGADSAELHFYTCLVFQSEKQKLEFIAQFPNVLCVDEVFIDGETFAAEIGHPVTPNQLLPIESKIKKKFAELAKIPKK